ncbi:Crp/Fnr family transcriptional regulator [Paracoccus sp. R86501]|uniref:Crp/Fnr family transcriptional regulator n=1 Tax=Paracoccus sp. R86501 TaxID=3101711 RepID=UPI00366AC272
MAAAENKTTLEQLRRIRGIDVNTSERLALFRRKMITVEAGDTIIFEGQEKRRGYFLCSGWASSVRHLIDGSDQILDVRIPGDFIGISDMRLKYAPHATEAITRVELAPISYRALLSMSAGAGRLAEAILFSINCDMAITSEHLVSVARRNPQVRTAHFLLELSERLTRVGLDDPDSFHCPLSQYLLADVLGLTAVHLNRTLRQLRERGFVSFKSATVDIHDRPGMIEFAGFDPTYLHQAPSRSAISDCKAVGRSSDGNGHFRAN